jgi:hypothetical protein
MKKVITAALLIIATTMTSCGGGSSGANGNEPPPPPQEPTVITTPTAVRVTAATPFNAGCLAVPAGATAYVNAEVEPHLAINPSNPNHLVAAWQQDRMSDGGARGLATSVSIDGGTSWSQPQAAPFSRCAGGSFDRVSDPWVAVGGSAVFQIGIGFNGGVLAAGARSAVLVSRSIDGGLTWGPATHVADDNGALFFNDKETLTIDSTDPEYVYAVWDRIDTSDHGPTRLARSMDAGLTWLPATTIYDPGNERQTIGNMAVTTPDGIVHIFFTELGPSASDPAQTEGHVSVIRSTDKGASWSAPTRIAELLAVGTTVPGQAQLSVRAGEILGTFAADPRDGTLYAAWQDSRFTGGAFDAVALAWSADGGFTWSAPIRVNADPSVPAFTPTLAVLPSGWIGVTYYDFRQAGTATYRPTDAWLTASSDRTIWRETRLAGNFDLLDAPDANGLFVGDYQGLSGDGSTFVTLYARTNNGDASNRTDVFSDRVNAVSIVTPAATIADASQKSGAQGWSGGARDRVARHLSAARAARHAQWRAWRGSVAEQSPDQDAGTR